MKNKSLKQLHKFIHSSKEWRSEFTEAMREIGRRFDDDMQYYTDDQCKATWYKYVLPEID